MKEIEKDKRILYSTWIMEDQSQYDKVCYNLKMDIPFDPLDYFSAALFSYPQQYDAVKNIQNKQDSGKYINRNFLNRNIKKVRNNVICDNKNT